MPIYTHGKSINPDKRRNEELKTKTRRNVLAAIFICFILLTVTGCAKNSLGKDTPLKTYWAEGSVPAKELNDYLSAVTDERSDDFIPAEDRIAVFDLDGTLMCETCPWCFEYMVFADYALNGEGGNCLTRLRIKTLQYTL